MKVLIIFPYYLPGFRSGGPQRTIQSIVEAYGSLVNIYILALNHDFGVDEIYDDIKPGWNRVGKANVKYVTSKEYNTNMIIQVAQNMDMVYACSLFSKYTIKTIIAKKVGKISKEVVVAPMGVFSAGAMKEKLFKKIVFLKTFKALRMFDDIRWCFTTCREKEEAEKYIGIINRAIVAEDLPRKPKENVTLKKNKKINELRIIFLSRICQKKNLKQCLTILNTKWNGKIIFDIYGTIEDYGYWRECREIIPKLKQNIKCNYCGEVKTDLVPDVFEKYDVFLFPTFGENYGHVIFEALASGCVPIISDKTIWNNLEINQCGFVVPLENINEFRAILDKCLKMDDANYSKWSNNSIEYANEYYLHSIRSSAYMDLFNIKAESD